MGLFDFFRKRRERESAIPGESPESLTRQLKGDGKPIGQPVHGAGQAQRFDLTNTPTDIGSMIAMFSQAFQGGNVEITQGESQVIDLRGSGLREEILGALEQHGIDPDAAPGGQIDAGQVPGLQEQIMRALENAGVDTSQLGDAGNAGGGDSGSGGA